MLVLSCDHVTSVRKRRSVFVSSESQEIPLDLNASQLLLKVWKMKEAVLQRNTFFCTLM